MHDWPFDGWRRGWAAVDAASCPWIRRHVAAANAKLNQGHAFRSQVLLPLCDGVVTGWYCASVSVELSDVDAAAAVARFHSTTGETNRQRLPLRADQHQHGRR